MLSATDVSTLTPACRSQYAWEPLRCAAWRNPCNLCPTTTGLTGLAHFDMCRPPDRLQSNPTVAVAPRHYTLHPTCWKALLSWARCCADPAAIFMVRQRRAGLRRAWPAACGVARPGVGLQR